MDRRGFLALLAGATTAAVSTYDQPSGCDTQIDTMANTNDGKDYVETFDKNGDLRHTLTSKPSLEAVDAENVKSESLPLWRVYKTNGDVVALDETGTEIARDADAATVWQDSFDAAYNKWSNDGNFKYEPAAIIDGGQLSYSLSSGIIAKRGCVPRNARFDGGSVGAGPTVRFGGPDNTFTHGAIHGANIYVKNAGDTGILFRDVANGQFTNIRARDSTNDGVRVESSLICTFRGVFSRNSGSKGFETTGNGDSGARCNANTWVGCRAMDSSGIGFHISSGTGQRFVGITSETNGEKGIHDSSLGYNTYLEPWCENNQWDGILADADGMKILGGVMGGNSKDTNSSWSIRLRGADQVVHGPLRTFGGDVFTTAPATDASLRSVDPSKWDEFNEGTRTTYNGVGRNSGDPNSTGDWNGNGREGVVVVDTSNSVVYHYRGGAWV